MTNAVVWKVGTGSDCQVWAIADSRVTLPRKERPPRVTDQAVKVLRLSVGVHGESKFSRAGGPFLVSNLGMVFAGAVVPALMTHAAVCTMLANLHPKAMGFPGMEKVAKLIAHVSQRYIRDAAIAYPIDDPPLCEFVVFGPDVIGLSLDSPPNVAYRIGPGGVGPSGLYEQAIDRVDLDAGEIAVIGTDCQGLREQIARLSADRGSADRSMEPRVALEMRIRAGNYDTVGGVLQLGILARNSFDLFGLTLDSDGGPRPHWLGFDCQNDVSAIIGMPVIVPDLR